MLLKHDHFMTRFCQSGGHSQPNHPGANHNAINTIH
jgi:hypothetical protein